MYKCENHPLILEKPQKPVCEHDANENICIYESLPSSNTELYTMDAQFELPIRVSKEIKYIDLCGHDNELWVSLKEGDFLTSLADINF